VRRNIFARDEVPKQTARAKAFCEERFPATTQTALTMTTMPRTFYTYLMSNKTNTVVYTGMTNDIERRVQEHKEGASKKSFTYRYKITKLVYYEEFDNPYDAILREKQIKAGSRKRKEELIKSMNPKRRDLSEDWK
jgi:putative endonuclease